MISPYDDYDDLQICLGKSICSSCYHEDDAPYPCKCGRPCETCLENYYNKMEDNTNDTMFSEYQDYDYCLVDLVDWTKKNGFFEELGISYENALGQMIIQVLKSSDVSPTRLFHILEEFLGGKELEIMNENAPINGWESHLGNGFKCNDSNLESTIESLIETFFLV